jgi:hypothetical protein
VCVGYLTTFSVSRLYRVSQEERSIFWEVNVSVILRKTLYEHVSYSERFPIIGAQYFEFGAQYFPSLPLCDQSQQPIDASHRFICFRHWRIMAGRKENIAPRIQNTTRQISETVWNKTHAYIHFFLRMTDIWTSQSIDLSSWDTL